MAEAFDPGFRCETPGTRAKGWENVSRMSRKLSILVVGLSLSASTAGADEPRAPRFRDVAAEAGIDFRFDNGARGRHDLVEIMGGGVALIDADGDGRVDIFFTNGGPIAGEPGRLDPPCRLYRNLGDWRFEDVTDSCGAPGPSYAMGVAVGDFDDDGRDDLFVTGWRDQRLYRNLGGGRFEDVTERAGVVSDRWSTSAAFADLDGDGDLDLYVCNYLDYDLTRAPACFAPDGQPDYCGPEVFPAQRDRLYRNNGDGTFTDVSDTAGIDDRDGRGLGVLVADLTGDGRLDLYVANDGTACFLFENLGGLRFRDIGEQSGVAYDGSGRPLAGMGVAWGDVDGDGRSDLLVSNFFGRSTIGFRNLGRATFHDESGRFGLTAATRDVLGFGLALADFDGDGDLDLLQGNGHVLDRARLGEPFAMRQILLENRKGGFVDVSRSAGPWFARPILARGVAVGDLDGDDRPDAVVAAIDAPAAVLRNESGGRCAAIELLGQGPGGRAAVGGVVRATTDGRTVTREVVGGGSYLSSSSRALFFGLGDAGRIERIDVTWPSGDQELFTDIHLSDIIYLQQGKGD
jgi:hypothetical protein